MFRTATRTLMVLECLRARPARVSEIARALSLSLSTASRLMKSLESRGFVTRLADNRFELGLKVLELASSLERRLDLKQVARQHLLHLASETGETVHLAVLDRGEVVYLDKIESTHPVQMASRVGQRAPAYCTGLGKAILAYLPPSDLDEQLRYMELKPYTINTITDAGRLRAHLAEVRERGYATDNSEHELDVCCIAAPVLGRDGHVRGAISIAVARARTPLEELVKYVPQLLKTSHAISRDLGYVPEAK